MDNAQYALLQLLQKEVGCVYQLLESLDLEYEALSSNKSEALEDVVRLKQEKIQQLESISSQREKLHPGASGASASDGVEQDQFFGNQKISDLWNELVDVAEKCHEKNRINGSIVDIVSKQTRHALDILHGISPGNKSESQLYNNTGQTTTSVNKRSLVQV